MLKIPGNTVVFSLYATSPAVCTVVSDRKSKKSLDVAVVCGPVFAG